MTRTIVILASVSVIATAQAHAAPFDRPSAEPQPTAQAQNTQAPPADGDAQSTTPTTEPSEIVVTGIRSSLERAAEIKRDATQVVDSIVADDIGKLPDPTTAAALQRVPGVQVANDRDNELSNVKIRGLSDISTTVDGRQVFTTTGRSVDLKDIPAQALKRVDVSKSQTAEQIEGGVAGSIDLRLNKPFDFQKPTLVLSARENYASRLRKGNPQLGALVTDRFDTGIGEIGVLVNASYSHADNERSQSNMTDRRWSGAGPLKTPGYLIPQVIQNMPNIGDVTRGEVNASLQWQASDALQVYVDGLYTYFRTTSGFTGFNPQPFTQGTSITNIKPTDNCFLTRVNGAGNTPSIVTDADGNESLQPYTVETVCDIDSATFNNIVVNQNSSSDRLTQKNKLLGGGVKYDLDGTKLDIDVAYQTSRAYNENVNLEAGQRVPTLDLQTHYDEGVEVTVGPQYPLNTDNLYLRNSFNQNFSLSKGSLFQAKADAERELGGILEKLQAGVRYSRQTARFQNVRQTNPIARVGCGNIGTPSEATACKFSSLGLSSDALSIIGFAPRLNGGTSFAGINPAYLRSEQGRNELRTLFGLPLSPPDYDPTHEFNATETSYAGYVQGGYELALGGDTTLDGIIGARAIETDRTITGFSDENGTLTPVTAKTKDFNLLPSATARLRFPGGFQARLDYSRTLSQPGFGELNPTQSLTYVGNVFLINHGSSGNPDLKPQKSDSYDASLEYYFGHGFVALTGFYRTIRDRVVSSSSKETIDGDEFLISRPRNVGKAKLQGIEASGQYFFDFLPGDLAGLGVMGAFTLVDSEIQGDDPLAGNPLQGVSKYNYTVGALYDRNGLSGRLVYTFRSKYYNNDLAGAVFLRPVDPDRIDEVYVPTLLNYVRPAGRLDFSLGYDVTKAFRIDVGGTNILRNETKTYSGQPYLNREVFGDETTYTIGVRIRI